MFDKVVFAGGGHRCWWQAGFWDAVTEAIELRPRVIAGVSAGAATACLLYANDSRRALAWYERELSGMRSNVRWTNLFRAGQRLMPHAAIYRKALRTLLGGDHYRELMWNAPEIRVQFSRLPPGMGPRRAVLTGMAAYSYDKYVRQSLHPTFGRRMGFTQEIRRVQDCRSERELVDLLVASSCTPPFTPVEMIDGEPCLDGGLVDNVPVDAVADVPGKALVLTTRRYKGLAPVFVRNGHVYVQPSRKIAVASWDYTSPQKYHQTYRLGREDGDAFLRTFALGRFNGLADVGSGAVPEVRADAGAEVGADVEAPVRADTADRPGQADATEGGTAVAFSADQPASSDGQLRSGSSFSASRI